MQMEFGLKQELQQKLVMTPQLRQAIAILQLSSLELTEMVENQLLENPVLELAESGEGKGVGEEQDETAATTSVETYMDWAAYFDGPADQEYVPVEKGQRATFEAVVHNTTLLRDHLDFQLHLAVMDDRLHRIGHYLIGCLDDNGYLQVDISEAASEIGEDRATLEMVLTIIQTFDPSGVGARCLKECLAIQARQKNVTDELILGVIEHHLDDVAAGRLKVIAEKLGRTPADVQQAVDYIRTLNPRPGCTFGGGQSLYVIPDITVLRVDQSYVIVINDNDTPRLTINPYYRQVVKEADSEARKYVEDRIQAAVWLIRSIEQRRRTLYNIMDALIMLQPDFFEFGPNYLRPLTMKRVADHIGVHESTVSRATAGKYVETPHGVFSLRAFFSAAVQSASGADVAASRIKRELKELISGEDVAAPYSDQALTDIFARRGVNLSRRTVAKYREELGIASSAKRKRY